MRVLIWCQVWQRVFLKMLDELLHDLLSIDRVITERLVQRRNVRSTTTQTFHRRSASLLTHHA